MRTDAAHDVSRTTDCALPFRKCSNNFVSEKRTDLFAREIIGSDIYVVPLRSYTLTGSIYTEITARRENYLITAPRDTKSLLGDKSGFMYM